MKNLLAAFLVLLALTATAQSEKPRTEFVISTDPTSLEVMPGETKELTLMVNRSNSFAKSKASFGVSSTLPAGMTIEFPETNSIEAQPVKIAASANVTPGTYTVLLNVTMQNKKKGTALKVLVATTNETATSKN